ncbi:helix-turn-helix domain-containing protein [Hymenobacter sp. RP-2-7]|uniref:Helix-turn-helix domain-containing protein n=1 Tax=Hymenobacter polaris TaxID=2682546 RepID=A0A7Y0AI74_9BACT|nr:helix-turn-helix domain-containing protein [Hymenobacter polaris]NML67856.1 helix-turn-helix domain-containing protein [Hymenobacter polaris]
MQLPDRLLNVREAAHYLRLTPEGVRKARRQGRLSGVHLKEKEWGFRQSELDRYLTRYNRHPLINSQ